MPGIREAAGEAGGEDVTRARRRPSSRVPRDKAARVARRPPPRAPALGSQRLARPRPHLVGGAPPPPPRSPAAAPTSRSAGWAGLGWAGLRGGRSGSRPFLGVSSLRADLRAGARRAAAAAAALGVPRRPRFGALGHHDGKVTAPGRRAPLAREGGCATGPPPARSPSRTPASRGPSTSTAPGRQRRSGQRPLPRASRPPAGPAQRQVKGLPRTMGPLAPPLRRTRARGSEGPGTCSRSQPTKGQGVKTQAVGFFQLPCVICEASPLEPLFPLL